MSSQLENGLHLGKRAAVHDRRDLLFAEFRDPKLAEYPQAHVGFGVERAAAISWQMLGNGPDDSVAPGFGGAGDCVEAEACNRVIYSNAIAKKPVPPFTGREAISLYSTLTGYRIGDDSTDQGTDMRAALNYARKHGVVDEAGHTHRIGGYCALEAGNFPEMMEALAVFDVISMGFEFPESAMSQFDAGKPWTYVRSAKISGGHDVMVVARPRLYYGDAVTWGRVQPFTSSFYHHLCDEAYGVFLPETLSGGVSPEGFNLADFKAALAAL